MLYNRGTGWVDWELSNFGNRISYIDDFPYNILEALAEYLKTGEEQNVEFNAEGWFYTFRFTYNVKVGDKVVYESTVDFASDFICEIEKNLVSWSHFPANRKSDEDYLELVDLIVEVRTELLDDNLIDRWLEIISLM